MKILKIMRRSVFAAMACTLSLLATNVMATEIFIDAHNKTSDRSAVFEDDEKVAYLYLTKVGSQFPEKDAIAYTRIAPGAKINWSEIKASGSTPPLTQDLASDRAMIKNPSEREFSFRWSSDGNAVALLRNGEPIAFAVASEKFGYSKAIAKSSPLANAWDERRYKAVFEK